METLTAEHLEHHWALDNEASQVLGERIDTSGQNGRIEDMVEGLDETAIIKRNKNRREIGRIFKRESNKGIIVIGPCSLDVGSDYGGLLDFIEEAQEANPDSVIAMRANPAKPRTGGGWTGLWYSTDPIAWQKITDTYQAAFNRGIPIVTEMTQETQLGALAPWLSGFWLGARDIPSTTLRSVSSAYHLPVGVKNGTDGDPVVVENTIRAISSNSKENKHSGADLGAIARAAEFPGIATGIVPVGEGNQEIAIFARGYEVPKDMPANMRRERALGYISTLCSMGVRLDSAVLIDGTHDVPPMFDIGKKDPDRIVPVLHIINEAVHNGEITDSGQLAGVIAEVSTTVGDTDPNYVLDTERKAVLSRLVGETVSMLSL